MKAEEEERCGGIVGFWIPREKTPQKLTEQDLATIRGWCACFGKPLFVVFAGKRQQFCHVFSDHESEGRAIPVVTSKDEEYVIGVDKP